MYVVKFELKMPKNIELSIGNDIRNKERMVTVEQSFLCLQEKTK